MSGQAAALWRGRAGAVELVGHAPAAAPSGSDLAAEIARGWSLHHAGRFEEAEAVASRITAGSPASADGWRLRAALSHQRGDHPRALEHAGRALALEPRDPLGHYLRGNALRDLGRDAEAQRAYHAALDLHPKFAEAHNNLGVIHKVAGRFREAAACFERAVAYKGDYVEAYSNLGTARQAMGEFDAAEDCYRAALALNPDMGGAHNNLGGLWFLRHDLQRAQGSLERALELGPGDPGVLNNLGNLHKARGDMDRAAACYEEALRANPGLAETYRHLMQIRPDEPRSERAAALGRRLAAGEVDAGAAVHLHFALGTVHDRAGDRDRAFAHYREGNRLKRSRTAYDPRAHERFVQRIEDAFSPELLRARGGRIGSDSALPVLVVGMPRSGTTLVEQILSSHPRVHGAGEVRSLVEAQHSLGAVTGGTRDYPECVDGLDERGARSLADRYLASLPRAPEALRVTDKMPDNYLRLGLFALLFPHGHVVHCRRDPVDTCLSIYFQCFTEDHPYAYALDEIGQRYVAYQRLMAYWREALPVPIHEVQYESLVADVDGGARALVAHVGLEWDPSCLAPERNPRAVFTASNWQVRQPVHGGSVRRWRHYEAHLGPLLEVLGR